MICPVCGVEMRIVSSRVAVTGDTAPDSRTRVLLRQQLRCPNPACSRRLPVTVEHLLYEGGAAPENGAEKPPAGAPSEKEGAEPEKNEPAMPESTAAEAIRPR